MPAPSQYELLSLARGQGLSPPISEGSGIHYKPGETRISDMVAFDQSTARNDDDAVQSPRYSMIEGDKELDLLDDELVMAIGSHCSRVRSSIPTFSRQRKHHGRTDEISMVQGQLTPFLLPGSLETLLAARFVSSNPSTQIVVVQQRPNTSHPPFCGGKPVIAQVVTGRRRGRNNVWSVWKHRTKGEDDNEPILIEKITASSHGVVDTEGNWVGRAAEQLRAHLKHGRRVKRAVGIIIGPDHSADQDERPWKAPRRGDGELETSMVTRSRHKAPSHPNRARPDASHSNTWFETLQATTLASPEANFESNFEPDFESRPSSRVSSLARQASSHSAPERITKRSVSPTSRATKQAPDVRTAHPDSRETCFAFRKTFDGPAARLEPVSSVRSCRKLFLHATCSRIATKNTDLLLVHTGEGNVYVMKDEGLYFKGLLGKIDDMSARNVGERLACTVIAVE